MPHRFGGDVLELAGRNVDPFGKALERVTVGEFGNGRRRTDLCGRAVGLVCKDMAAVAELRGGERGHAPELTATQNADGRARD